VKRIVLMFVIGLAGLGITVQKAEAQRSGTMQVTARVVDTRDSWNGLTAARNLASSTNLDRQSSATVETSLTKVSIQYASPPSRTVEPADRPREARVTIQYLRN
jgi:hypothetical protein